MTVIGPVIIDSTTWAKRGKGTVELSIPTRARARAVMAMTRPEGKSPRRDNRKGKRQADPEATRAKVSDTKLKPRAPIFSRRKDHTTAPTVTGAWG